MSLGLRLAVFKLPLALRILYSWCRLLILFSFHHSPVATCVILSYTSLDYGKDEDWNDQWLPCGDSRIKWDLRVGDGGASKRNLLQSSSVCLLTRLVCPFLSSCPPCPSSLPFFLDHGGMERGEWGAGGSGREKGKKVKSRQYQPRECISFLLSLQLSPPLQPHFI